MKYQIVIIFNICWKVWSYWPERLNQAQRHYKERDIIKIGFLSELMQGRSQQSNIFNLQGADTRVCSLSNSREELLLLKNSKTKVGDKYQEFVFGHVKCIVSIRQQFSIVLQQAYCCTPIIFKTCNTWLFSQGHLPLFP